MFQVIVIKNDEKMTVDSETCMKTGLTLALDIGSSISLNEISKQLILLNLRLVG